MKESSRVRILVIIQVIITLLSGCNKDKNFREKYLGNWDFTVNVTLKHGCSGGGIPFNDTAYTVLYKGVINKGSGDKEIIIHYTESMYTTNVVDENGNILNRSSDPKVGSSGKFEGDNKLTLSIWQNTSGACYSREISGERLIGEP